MTGLPALLDMVHLYLRNCSARLDGLMKREEIEGTKMIETFCGRDDRLIYRSATYMSDQPQAEDDEFEE